MRDASTAPMRRNPPELPMARYPRLRETYVCAAPTLPGDRIPTKPSPLPGGTHVEALASVSPDGTVYPLPREEEHQAELARIERLVEQARDNGQEIVVVMGLGFVGAVMAAIVADSTDADGRPSKFDFRKVVELRLVTASESRADDEITITHVTFRERKAR